MHNKHTIIAIICALTLIGGAVVLSNNTSNEANGFADGQKSGSTKGVGNVVMENGVQYVEITARGGYTPKVSKAKAGVPTVIRMKTENSYDCSIALVIPDIKYQKYLPRTGEEIIEIPLEKTQGTLRGMCSMAMYHFQIDFE